MLTVKKKKKLEIRGAGSSKATVLDLDFQQESPVQQESLHHMFGHSTDSYSHVSIQLERWSHIGCGGFLGRQSAREPGVMQGCLICYI